MRISIREALFSGEEVDDWEPPTSKWISLCEGGFWTPEARELFPDPKNYTDNSANQGLLHVHEVADRLYEYSSGTMDFTDETPDLKRVYRLMPYKSRLMLFNPGTKTMIFLPDKDSYTEEQIETMKETHS